MRLSNVAVQWATVLVLLAIVVAINFVRPEWLSIEMSGPEKGKKRDGEYQAVDGDSFRAGKIEVRLFGIDAPEYRQMCRASDGAQKPCGKLARDQLSKLIRNKEVSCKTLDRDRYGRQVAVCKDGTLDINREMVRQGWALAYRKHSIDYVAAEREARNAKRGIWAWEFDKPEEYRSRSRAVEGNAGGFKDE
jgi:endonuclease YncB( thermonuclease family)